MRHNSIGYIVEKLCHSEHIIFERKSIFREGRKRDTGKIGKINIFLEYNQY